VTYDEALAWLATHTNYELSPPRAGSVGGLSLERMHALVDVLDHPQRQYPVVHVTGTNGKGSTARMAAALLAETGLSVGVYSSPHLHRVNERISRNGEPIADHELAEVLGDLRGLVGVAGVDPSWFELVTAAAFRWFADVAVDVAVVEVGMLGRYDATNVADGAVAVVTNVGPDHTDFREGWRWAVAEEKAGIVKPGSTLVLGETDSELRRAFVDEGPAAVWDRGEEFACDENVLAVGGRMLDLRTPNGTVEGVFLPLHGAHQGENAACALAAAEALFDRPLGVDVVRDAFAGVTMPGRFEIVGREPLVVLDGAHNAAGAASAAQTLADDFEVEGERILVVGLLAPRDATSVLEALDAGSAHLVVACTPDSPRGVPAAEVASAAARLGVAAEVVPDVRRAVDRALGRAGAGDAVLVTGSLYVVGAARSHLRIGGG
jgi:dihydrofolate synthase/folylpolyglutamate synthase